MNQSCTRNTLKIINTTNIGVSCYKMQKNSTKTDVGSVPGDLCPLPSWVRPHRPIFLARNKFKTLNWNIIFQCLQGEFNSKHVLHKLEVYISNTTSVYGEYYSFIDIYTSSYSQVIYTSEDYVVLIGSAIPEWHNMDLYLQNGDCKCTQPPWNCKNPRNCGFIGWCYDDDIV